MAAAARWPPRRAAAAARAWPALGRALLCAGAAPVGGYALQMALFAQDLLASVRAQMNWPAGPARGPRPPAPAPPRSSYSAFPRRCSDGRGGSPARRCSNRSRRGTRRATDPRARAGGRARAPRPGTDSKVRGVRGRPGLPQRSSEFSTLYMYPPEKPPRVTPTAGSKLDRAPPRHPRAPRRDAPVAPRGRARGGARDDDARARACRRARGVTRSCTRSCRRSGSLRRRPPGDGRLPALLPSTATRGGRRRYGRWGRRTDGARCGRRARQPARAGLAGGSQLEWAAASPVALIANKGRRCLLLTCPACSARVSLLPAKASCHSTSPRRDFDRCSSCLSAPSSPSEPSVALHRERRVATAASTSASVGPPVNDAGANSSQRQSPLLLKNYFDPGTSRCTIDACRFRFLELCGRSSGQTTGAGRFRFDVLLLRHLHQLHRRHSHGRHVSYRVRGHRLRRLRDRLMRHLRKHIRGATAKHDDDAHGADDHVEDIDAAIAVGS